MKKPRLFYGYWIIAACFLFSVIGAGCSHASFSFFIKHLQMDMSWTRTQIMAAFTILVLLMGLAGPFTGRLIDRFGARKVIPLGAFLVAVGFALLSQMTNLAQYYIGYAIIGVGSTAIGPIASSCVVSHWFVKRRGRAIGIMSTGMGIAGLVFAPLVAVYLIPHFGWSHSYLALAVLVAGIVIPLSLFVIRTRPSEMGLSPDGIESSNSGNIAEAAAKSAEGLSLNLAIATPAFWIMAVSVIFNHTHLGIWQSMVPHLSDIGFPIGIAASVVSTTSVMTSSGMLFFGWLCDKIHAKYASAIGLTLIALGIVILINIRAGSPVWIVWMYAIIFGFGIGSWIPTLSMLTSTVFGMAYYGTIFGVMSLFQNVGGSIGPLFAGYVYDLTDSYRWAFIIILALVVLAIPLILAVKRSDLLGCEDGKPAQK